MMVPFVVKLRTTPYKIVQETLISPASALSFNFVSPSDHF